MRLERLTARASGQSAASTVTQFGCTVRRNSADEVIILSNGPQPDGISAPPRAVPRKHSEQRSAGAVPQTNHATSRDPWILTDAQQARATNGNRSILHTGMVPAERLDKCHGSGVPCAPLPRRTTNPRHKGPPQASYNEGKDTARITACSDNP